MGGELAKGQLGFNRLCRLAQRYHRQLLVQVVNPLVWLQDLEHDSNT